MRFYRLPSGEHRFKTVFLFFPKELKNETRWLEWATIKQRTGLLGEWYDSEWAN